jgi:hypothetical protein
MRRFWIAVLAVAAGTAIVACHEEGSVEKAGRKVDEVVDKLQHPNEGTLEKLGRKTDEAIDEAKEAVEDAGKRE